MKKTLQEKLDKAVAFLKNLNIEELETGKYEVDEDFYYSVQEYETKAVEDCKFESHRKYADIQMIVRGKEAIDIAPVSSCTVKTEYSEEKDVMFWNDAETMARMELTEGSYAIYLPDVAHKPGIAAGPSVKVKKCVGKVRVE